MNQERYWEIIKTANEMAMGDKKILIAKIKTLFKNKKEGQEFYKVTNALIEEHFMNNNKLLSVLRRMSPTGFITDDTYMYIIAGILSRGEHVYKMIISNPKNIYEIDNNYYNWKFEEFMYIGM